MLPDLQTLIPGVEIILDQHFTGANPKMCCVVLPHTDPLWNIYSYLDTEEKKTTFLEICTGLLEEENKMKIFQDARVPEEIYQQMRIELQEEGKGG